VLGLQASAASPRYTAILCVTVEEVALSLNCTSSMYGLCNSGQVNSPLCALPENETIFTVLFFEDEVNYMKSA
jgi:hypothetical protein